MFSNKNSLPELVHALETDQVRARDLIEDAISISAQPDSERDRIFIDFKPEEARKQADIIDQQRKQNRHRSPFAGIAFTSKDIFDLQGQTTCAGSVILKDNPPAKHHAKAIHHLLKAGMINIGRTNMTEFAYSGIGLNPHYGTPASIWKSFDKQNKTMRRCHVPGGSSSGAAVSVAEGIVPLAIGTDTGGSCRIPAAFNGICGFKSTFGRIATKGVFPLAKSLDSVGPLARDVGTIGWAVSLLERGYHHDMFKPIAKSNSHLTLAVLHDFVLEDLDLEVANAFEAALYKISQAGHTIKAVHIKDLNRLPEINASGGISAVEAYAIHQRWLSQYQGSYDPKIYQRIMCGKNISAVEYLDILNFQNTVRHSLNALYQEVNAIVLPCVKMLAPTIEKAKQNEHYGAINFGCLRNSFIANFASQCAITLPMHDEQKSPSGFMLMGQAHDDKRLIAIAQVIEDILQQ